jgi:hypothetical protein
MALRLTLLQQEEQRPLQKEMETENPLALFMYALRAPETRRQWPRRLKTFLDFLEMEGVSSLEDQAKLFIGKSRQQSYWAQDSLIRFMNIQRERARRGEISESTIPNYYKAAKLFCEMNDVVLNWKKILYMCLIFEAP